MNVQASMMPEILRIQKPNRLGSFWKTCKFPHLWGDAARTREAQCTACERWSSRGLTSNYFLAFDRLVLAEKFGRSNLQGTNISHLGNREIIFKSTFKRGYVSFGKHVELNSLQNPPPWDLHPVLACRITLTLFRAGRYVPSCRCKDCQHYKVRCFSHFDQLIMFAINFYCSWFQKLLMPLCFKNGGLSKLWDEQKLLPKSKRSPAAPKLCCIMGRTRWGPASQNPDKDCFNTKLVIEWYWMLDVY